MYHGPCISACNDIRRRRRRRSDTFTPLPSTRRRPVPTASLCPPFDFPLSFVFVRARRVGTASAGRGGRDPSSASLSALSRPPAPPRTALPAATVRHAAAAASSPSTLDWPAHRPARTADACKTRKVAYFQVTRRETSEEISCPRLQRTKRDAEGESKKIINTYTPNTFSPVCAPKPVDNARARTRFPVRVNVGVPTHYVCVYIFFSIPPPIVVRGRHRRWFWPGKNRFPAVFLPPFVMILRVSNYSPCSSEHRLVPESRGPGVSSVFFFKKKPRPQFR